MSWRACLTGLLVALCLAGQLGLAVHAQVTQGQEESARPEVQVIQPQLITFGSLRIYLLGFPYSPPGAPIEYPSSMSISVAVWGASVQNPVLVWIDGREVARITEDGVFTIMMELPEGCHHAAVLCPYGIIASSSFYVRPPPPPGEAKTIPWSDVQAMLEELRREVWRNCLIAACAGVVAGCGLKRASKIEFHQLYVPFAVPIGIGLQPQLFATLYWLVPFGLTAILAYHFVRDFAEWRGYMAFGPNRVAGDVFPLWGEKYIAGLRPVKEILLGRGLVLYKRFMAHDAATIEFEFAGEVYVVYVLRSLEDIQETEDAFILRCDKTLARALVRADILKVVDKELSELRLEVMAYREMVKTAAFRAMSVIDDFFATTPIDRLTFLNVDEIREQLKARVMRELAEQGPEESRAPAVTHAVVSPGGEEHVEEG